MSDRLLALRRFLCALGVIAVCVCTLQADVLDGRIGVESQVGEGSAFGFWIPISIVGDAP